MEFNNNIPIYIQIMEQIKINIISGKLLPGEKLESVRELSMKLKVNPNTLQKALSELENMNLIFTERTNGKFVTQDKKIIDKYRTSEALNLTKNYIQSMKQLGVTKDEINKYWKG